MVLMVPLSEDDGDDVDGRISKHDGDFAFPTLQLFAFNLKRSSHNSLIQSLAEKCDTLEVIFNNLRHLIHLPIL